MTATIDLRAYLRRVGYEGEHTATLDTLRGIVVRHTEAIPFENLDPLLRRPVRLDAASLEEKLVHGGRGGYCFEHNLLLRHALEALGFRVAGLAARVLWNAPEGAVGPRTHMLLRVDHGGAPFIVDVGFGGQTLTGVLRLVDGAEQPTPHEPFRLVRAGHDWVMQSMVRGAWRPLYRFDLQEQHLVDYEAASWFLTTHPSSHFLHALMAARTAPGRRYALRNNELAVHHLGGGTEKRTLTSAAELRHALENEFRLTLPDGPELDATLERLTGRP
jgi:N-hydroxyarylamine O-acetyltransferase